MTVEQAAAVPAAAAAAAPAPAPPYEEVYRGITAQLVSKYPAASEGLRDEHAQLAESYVRTLHQSLPSGGRYLPPGFVRTAVRAGVKRIQTLQSRSPPPVVGRAARGRATPPGSVSRSRSPVSPGLYPPSPPQPQPSGSPSPYQPKRAYPGGYPASPPQSEEWAPAESVAAAAPPSLHPAKRRRVDGGRRRTMRNSKGKSVPKTRTYRKRKAAVATRGAPSRRKTARNSKQTKERCSGTHRTRQRTKPARRVNCRRAKRRKELTSSPLAPPTRRPRAPRAPGPRPPSPASPRLRTN